MHTVFFCKMFLTLSNQTVPIGCDHSPQGPLHIGNNYTRMSEKLRKKSIYLSEIKGPPFVTLNRIYRKPCFLSEYPKCA